MSLPKNILVCVDGSDPSQRAVTLGGAMAKAFGARLDLVNVVDLRQIDVYDGFYLTDDQLNAIQAHARQEILDKAKATLPADVDVHLHLLKGAALDGILLQAAEADLILVGRTGKNALERFIEGSISRGLSQHSTVPVVVVP